LVQALGLKLSDWLWKETASLRPLVDSRTGSEIERFAKSTATSRGITNMLQLAKGDASITANLDEFDSDPWLLNVANGTLDLRTGTLRSHAQADLLTKLAPVEYDPAAKCPAWERFLSTIFNGNSAILSYVQRLAGYSLTGSTREHVLAILNGTGANGKSTFLNTLLSLLGNDYSMKAPPGLLLAKRREEHSTERADLRGKRLVVAIELDEGSRLAESLAKELTGGDPIRARKLFHDNEQFQPTHKIVIAANHRPDIRGRDVGIWRRIKLLPFTVVIPKSERDPELPAKLAAELPGILNYCIAGCLAWQKTGLSEPKEIVAATAAYRQQSDLLGQFFADRCVFGKDREVKRSCLREAYEDWCRARWEKPESDRRMWQYLERRDVTRRTSNGTYYVGVALSD
jgi:putative DNA primase/helicase